MQSSNPYGLALFSRTCNNMEEPYKNISFFTALESSLVPWAHRSQVHVCSNMQQAIHTPLKQSLTNPPWMEVKISFKIEQFCPTNDFRVTILYKLLLVDKMRNCNLLFLSFIQPTLIPAMMIKCDFT